MILLARAVLPVALLALPLAACGNDQTTAAPPSQAHASSTPDGHRVDLPTGVSFTAPAGWDEVSSSTVSDVVGSGPGADVMDELAGRMGVDPATFRAQVKSLDVFLAAPHAEHGFLSNINATHVARSLPSRGVIEMQYRGLGGSDVEVAPADVAHADAMTVTYTLDIAHAEMHGEAILVEHDGQTAVITVTAREADEAQTLAEGVLDSLTVPD